MRMHTIPQNVSAYEDKIVGALIGKQFVYLAIGGVIAVVLVTTEIGPAVFRIPLALIIVLFTVALALFRPNDRPFDELFFSYCRAIFGPTEWTWGKELSIPPQLVKVLSLGEELQIPTKSTISLKDSQSQKRRQAQHYQRLMTHRQITGLDDSEIGFIEQLDFSLNVPQQVFNATKGQNDAPPMLTRENYQQVKPTKAPPVEMKNFTVSGSINPLASTDTNNFTYISADNSIATTKPHIQIQANRSLSRQALAHATLTMPVRGEIRLDIPAKTQSDLQTIISNQTTNTPQSLTIATQQKSAGPTSNQIISATMTEPPTSPNSSQPSPQNDITKVSSFTSEPVTTDQNPAMNQNPNQQQPNSTPSDDQPQGEYEATFGTPNRQYFPVDQQPVSEQNVSSAKSEPPTQNPAPLTLTDIANTPTQVAYNTPQPQPDSTMPTNKVSETDADSIENALSDLQQQAVKLNPDTPNQVNPTGLGKFDKFTTAPSSIPPTIDVNLTNLPINQPQTNASDNSSYTPLPINPVLNPESINQQPTASEIQSPDINQIQPEIQPPIDNQASQIVQSVPTMATKQLVLSSEPNIINGRVIDAQGQSVPSVIIVVKNEQGEAKRALKTNKLGQFIVTTPLSNGTYTVEVDKKGFNFDIIQVQLTGMVLPAIEIHAKDS